jgi:hypothetical protein
VILVIPQALLIVQRGKIYAAAKYAGFGEHQVHLIKETTAAALAFAHDAAIWSSPGSLLPVLVCCPSDVYGTNTDKNNVDAAIFYNECGILSMGESAGHHGLGLIGVQKDITKFKKRIVPFTGEMNANSVIVHLDDDDGSYENVPCFQKDEMQHFRSLRDRVKRRSCASESDDLLDEIREHLTKPAVCYLHSLSNYLSVLSI